MKTDGNVVYPNFRHRAEQREPLLEISFHFHLLYADERVALTRITSCIDGKESIAHVTTELGACA